MKARPTQSRKGVKGQLPLAGSRDSVPCGVWGNAPTVPRPTCSKGTVNKAQAAKRPCQQFCASADAPSKRLFSECRGFRACGRDQRALRSPSGLLRCPPEITIWLCLLLQLVRKKYTNQITSTTNQVTWVTTEGFQRATGKPFGRRRSGDSPATIKIQ